MPGNDLVRNDILLLNVKVCLASSLWDYRHGYACGDAYPSKFCSLDLVGAGALDTLKELSTWCDLMIVTSRQHVIEDETLEWISQHYPSVFQSIHFGNHFSKQGLSKKKSAICRSACSPQFL